MSNSEKFEKLFKSFEEETRKKINNEDLTLSDCINTLKGKRYNPYYRDYDFIEFCRKIRNIKFHSNDDVYFYLTDETIYKLETILDEVKHPFTVENKSIKNIYYATLSSNVKEVMKQMNEKCYTHIPIYDDNCKNLVGIFSEYSLYDFVLKNEFIVVTDETKFSEIENCIKVDNSKERVFFEARNSLYDDVVNKFIKEYKEKNKLDCIMVTQNGKIGEKVIGILTIWDIIGKM